MNEPARAVSIAGAWTCFVVVSVLPIAVMLAGSLTSPAGDWTLSAYRDVLGDARQWQLLDASLRVAVGAAVVAGAIGSPVGYVLARGGLKRPGTWRLLLVAPLLIPPYVLALAWVLCVGPAGPLARLFAPGLLIRIAYSTEAAAWVLGIGGFPLVMLGVEAALRNVSARTEDAARLVAPPLRVWRAITLPLIAPALGATLLTVFALALTEFSVPGLLRVRVFTTEVFTAFSAFYDFARAAAMATPLLALTLVAMGLATKAAHKTPLSTRQVAMPAPAPQLVRRLGLAVVAAAGTIAVLLPLGALASDALQGRSRAPDLSAALPAVFASLTIAVYAATTVAVLSAVLGYARTRVVRRGWLIDLGCAWLFAVPSTVTGVGLIRLWNRPELDVLYGTWGLVVVASVARFLPLGVLWVGAAGRQISTSIEEAAVISGARWFRRWCRVWLPQARSAIIAVWGITFVLAFGELGASILVVPPGGMTLPVHVYTMVANAPPGQLSMLALIQALTGFTGLALAHFALRRRLPW